MWLLCVQPTFSSNSHPQRPPVISDPEPWLKPLDAELRGGLKQTCRQQTDGRTTILTPKPMVQNFRTGNTGFIGLGQNSTVTQTVTETQTVTTDEGTVTATVTVTVEVTVPVTVTTDEGTITVTITTVDFETVTVTDDTTTTVTVTTIDFQTVTVTVTVPP